MKDKIRSSVRYQDLYGVYVYFIDKMLSEDDSDTQLQYKKWIEDNEVSPFWLQLMEEDLELEIAEG